jgi:hypothetical protein
MFQCQTYGRHANSASLVTQIFASRTAPHNDQRADMLCCRTLSLNSVVIHMNLMMTIHAMRLSQPVKVPNLTSLGQQPPRQKRIPDPHQRHQPASIAHKPHLQLPPKRPSLSSSSTHPHERTASMKKAPCVKASSPAKIAPLEPPKEIKFWARPRCAMQRTQNDEPDL